MKLLSKIGGIAGIILSLSACEHAELVSDSRSASHGLGVVVMASAETQSVGQLGLDAADDPEIWVNPENVDDVAIFATDKKAGLYVFDLKGKILDFYPSGPINNVDVRTVNGRPLIIASDRQHNGIAVFQWSLERKLSLTARLSLPTSEAYGFCMGHFNGQTQVVVVGIDGDVAIARLEDTATGMKLSLLDRFDIGSQSEGCVIDDRTGQLYIAEEAKGIWVFDLSHLSRRTLLQRAPSEALKPDVEGLSLLVEPEGNVYLVASSQGDSAFAVWDVTQEPVYKGRFIIKDGPNSDEVTGTDGIAAHGGRVGPYAQGIIVVQDDIDTDTATKNAAREQQNFKILDWQSIKQALSIP